MESALSVYRRPARPLWRRCLPWALMCLLAAVALVLGYVGFCRLPPTPEQPPDTALTTLYRSIQLFVLESGSIAGPLPWQLDAARFLAPVLPAWALLMALAVVFRSQIRALRLSRARGHTIVCGLGQRGLQLVRDFYGEGKRVVVVEGDEGNDDIRVCEELGAMVVVGDAEDPALLASVGAARARNIVAVCSDDGTNVEIAAAAYALAQGKTDGDATHCYVHMVDMRLCDLLNRHRMFRDTTDAFAVRIFSVYENAARLLWREHALERDLRGPDDQRSVHLVVLGMGQMGESVMLQAVRTGHFANGRKLRVTVIDRDADARRTDLLHRYANLERVCDIRFLETDVESGAFAESYAEWAAADHLITTAAVCFDSDSLSLACALNVVGNLGDPTAPIMVRLSREGGLASLLQPEAGGEVARRLHAFGAISRSCGRDLLLDEKLDTFARAIHEDYVARRKDDGSYDAASPAQFPWDRLDEGYRDSNRQQADHIAIKLRAVGCRAAETHPGREPVEAFTDDEVELLAKMEHARWNAERLLAGWTPGPERDNERKVHPYIAEWSDLPENIKEYDREAVRNIPRLLALIGRGVFRCLPGNMTCAASGREC